MAKGNDGNYLQHALEVSTAVQLAHHDRENRLHNALTHGMAPYEPLECPKGAYKKLYKTLCKANRKTQPDEHPLVTAYRKAKASRTNYPNTAELLRSVVGTDKLRGGITETCAKKYEELKEVWVDTKIRVANSSWRQQLDAGDVLDCPSNLNVPWMFSMDPMSYVHDGSDDDNQLHCSDLDRLVFALKKYCDSEMPGIVLVFVYGMGSQKPDRPRQFRNFMKRMAIQLPRVSRYSYWLTHNGGNRNFAVLLASNVEFCEEFLPCGITRLTE